MGDVKQLIKELRQVFDDMGHDKEWEKLRDRIMSQKHTVDSLRELDRDVRRFFKSNAPKEDKIKLMGYTESLAILMDAVNNGLMQ